MCIAVIIVALRGCDGLFELTLGGQNDGCYCIMEEIVENCG